MKKLNKKVSYWLFDSFIWLAVLLLIVDLVSKQIVLHNMVPGQSIKLIGNFLEIQYVINDGMAFGLKFENEIVNRVIFVVISLIGAAILIGVFVVKHKKIGRYVTASLMLMTSGCIGNLIDRAFYSAKYLNNETNGVVDFIGFNFGSYHFPRFNVADSCLVIGTIMLIVWLFVTEIKDMKEEKAKQPKQEYVPGTKVLSKDEIEQQEKVEASKNSAEFKEENKDTEPDEVQ